jgi:asparagine synthase (glutamine-hydrolysing)
MCGFIGVVSKEKIDDTHLLESNKIQICRGPDELKKFSKKITFEATESSYNSTFIFNRLAIQDLTFMGSQPMYSDKFNTLLLFNGEIFNHNELREMLKKEEISFDSNSSDTEVLLMGLSIYGESFIEKVIGQFSIFFIDYDKNILLLIRDRLGQKPLFVFEDDKDIVFGTNLKSLATYTNTFEISEESIIDYIEYGIVPSPNTIFKNIKKLQPGELYKYQLTESHFNKQQYTYWKPEDFIDEKKFSNDVFFDLVRDAIELRADADVPVASFLSGGLDSTYIVKTLNDLKKKNQAYTVSFDNQKYDEKKWAQIVTKKLNINSKIIDFKLEDIEKEVQNAISSLDEPYSDPSLIPSFLITSKIADDFKVAISGDGGDEIFIGYERIFRTLNGRKYSNLLIQMLFNYYPYFFGTGNKILSRSNKKSEAYKSFLSDFKLRKKIFSNKTGNFNISDLWITDKSELKNCLLSDFKFYLSEMMLLKIDRTSMANSLEVRSPFVDHRIIEYILSVNLEKYLETGRKSLLKDALKHTFSSDFINRKKMGFVFDIENWIFDSKDVANTIDEGYIKNNLSKNILKNLTRFRTKVNAQRLWKIYIFEKYLSEHNS